MTDDWHENCLMRMRVWLEPRDSACAHLKLNKNYCYIKMFNKVALILHGK